jgi:hypothetical protein
VRNVSQERDEDDKLLETIDHITDRFGKGMLKIGGTMKTDKLKSK